MAQTYKIDASGERLGRLAVRVASLLRGKDQPDFLAYKVSNNKVIVFNTTKIVISGKKFENKKYFRHSGYPGGIKEVSFKDLFERDPNEPLKRAVYGMLPKNKLRDKMIKNLKLYAGEIEKQK
jgi:large subunit ribosomal protein L13